MQDACVPGLRTATILVAVKCGQDACVPGLRTATILVAVRCGQDARVPGLRTATILVAVKCGQDARVPGLRTATILVAAKCKMLAFLVCGPQLSWLPQKASKMLAFLCIGRKRVVDLVRRGETAYYVFEDGHELPVLCFCCGKPLVFKNLDRARRDIVGRRLEGMSFDLVELEDGSEVSSFG